jgi:hypothetical protein
MKLDKPHSCSLPGYWNLKQYRKAKSCVKRGKPGFYPKICWDGKTSLFVFHRSLERLQILCSAYIKCPRYFIRTNKRKRYGYYYVRLVEPYMERWIRYMNTHDDWKSV